MKPRAAVTLLLLLAALLTGCFEDDEETVEAVRDAGDWERLEEVPLSPRADAIGLSLGDGRALIAGGNGPPYCGVLRRECLKQDRPALTDGAIFDSADRSWTPIADAPVPIGENGTAILDGIPYVYIKEQDRPRSERAFLSYDPGRDRWARHPLPPRENPLIYPSKGRIISPGVGKRIPPYAFDPATRSWTALRMGLKPHPDEHLTRDGQYPSARHPAIPEGQCIGSFVTIREKVAGECPVDTSENADDPREHAAGVLDGDASRYGATGDLVLDVANRAWIEPAELPAGDDGFYINETTVAAGELMLVFGGGRSEGDGYELGNEAWLWTPPGE